jgi:N-acyl-phosphatidylethanolamine-hydrolysing phospholipase D
LHKARKFINPWPNAEQDNRGSALLRWQWQRIRYGTPSNPPPGTFPLATPNIAQPRAPLNELRITWLGHASFLLQLDGLNILLDPHLTRRASPFKHVGPSRFVECPVKVEDLPPVDAVLLSHDHYDHLDEQSVRALHKRFGDALAWVTPLEYCAWFARRGVTNVVELDWWGATHVKHVRVVATPAQHWTRRGRKVAERLWASFMIEGTRKIYFAGDSGYCPAFREIGEQFGGCDIAIMPIGAYEPRWFMKPVHMNPEEAVQSYLDLRAQAFVPMHWGTFRLTDEDMREPPVRLRAAWEMAGLPNRDLHILQHGETLVMEN